MNVEEDEHDMIDEAMSELESWMALGFNYLYERDNNQSTSKIRTPSGKNLNLADIYRHLRRLEFNNPHQIECLNAYSVFLAGNLYFND